MALEKFDTLFKNIIIALPHRQYIYFICGSQCHETSLSLYQRLL